MSKLKKILSPRKFILILTILIFLAGFVMVNMPAQVETQGIVTSVAIDLVDSEIQLACGIITPKSGKQGEVNCYFAKGESISQAVATIGLQLGKELGFSQCDVIAIGDNIAESGAVRALDYLSRTKKVGKNELLVNFSGKADDFINAIIYLENQLALSMAQIVQHNKDYIYAVDSNIEYFYKGYYSVESISILPKIDLIQENLTKGIMVKIPSSNSQSSGGDSASLMGGDGSSQSNSETFYLVNDGTTTIFKNGNKLTELPPEDTENINIFKNSSKMGNVRLNGISDEIYHDATVVLNLEDKKTNFKFKFIDGVPHINTSLELYVTVDEIVEKSKNEEILKRTDELLTKAVVDNLRNNIKKKAEYSFEKMRAEKTDFVKFYSSFEKFHNKKWKKYLDSLDDKKDYLNGIVFNVDIKVAQFL